GAISRLPSGAAVYADLTTAAVKDTALDEMVRIVEQDPGMAAKILQLVNSSFFGRAEEMESARAAVVHMGVEPVQTLALAARAFTPAGGDAPGDRETARLRCHAVAVAQAARALSPDSRLADTAYTAGLLHDVGKLVLAAHLPEDYAAAQRRIASTGQATHVVEREVFGTTHAEVGAYLLGLWGLPALVVDTVAHHHDPERAPNNPLIGVLIAAHANLAAAGNAA
ncbi:MAG: HDOD domain-containing protein, partial [Acidobacteria bacterium]|nr:HDOD domain-containing protein [Acidobacteriota bacterium]